MRRAAIGALALLAVTSAAAVSTQEGWRTFEGSWSATGRRESVPIEGEGAAAIVHVSGALVLALGDGLSRGFQADVIAFHDGVASSVGRAVWTDERGDRVFSTLEGEALETGRRIRGTITGGTGRYEGLSGEYTLSWQYVVRAEDGAIQGRSADLKGRYRVRGSAP